MSNSKRVVNDVTLTPELAILDVQAFADLAPDRNPVGAAPGTDASLLATSVASSVTATYVSGARILNVFGDDAGNSIKVSRDAAGNICVNDGAVPIAGGPPKVANTDQISVYGSGGDDVITLDETRGALPRANLFGGAGNDTLTGGSGNDMLFGQAGNDTLFGRGGDDLLFGGADDDVLVGGAGNDQMYGESGNDRMIWNHGDGTDLMEGGAGIDTAEVNGGNGAETFTVTANGTRVRLDRLDPAPFSLDIGTTEQLVVNMGGGDDFFSATGNLAALIQIRVDGGAGNDTILGSNGADILLGGAGNDFIDGQQGNDFADLGAGNDVFQWDPGDGSDIVEGGTGTDTLRFNGSAGSEIFEASANGERLSFTRNLGNITMDLNDMEVIEINALGGADTINIRDLSGTDVREVAVNLAGTLGGTAGDAQADTVIATASNAKDVIEVTGDGSSVAVRGLPARINVTNSEGANDSLVINALDGDDVIRATALPAGTIRLTIDGGGGNDRIYGSQGADVFLAGDGNDLVVGDNGNDVALLGAGDDRFQWDPGDGDDTIEGGEGTDTLLFNGAGESERIDIVADGGRVRLFRDVDFVSMDLNDVERIELNAFGGADNIFVGDLTGTDVNRVNIDLGGPNGGGDGETDTVTVNGSQGADQAITVARVGAQIVVTTPAAAIHIARAEAGDHLVVNGQGGDDVIDASAFGAGRIGLRINGGLGNDVLIGSAGGDFIHGGDGNDLLSGGDGNDTFEWNPGDDNDTIEGGGGIDTLVFNGANVAETISIAAVGERVQLFRNVASVTQDMDDVERIRINAQGGADTLVVNDLSGSDITEVAINLAAAGGAGDGAQDSIIVNGTSGDDVALVFGDATGVQVLGLAPQITITGAEGANDRLFVNGGDGDDIIDASAVQPGTVLLTLDGGAGDDIIIGSAGDDVLIGGEGNDILIGGGGNDIFIPGPGDDIVIQGFVAGAGTDDRIDLTGRGLSFEWLMAHASEVDGDTVLDLGDQQILLRGIGASALHQDDFLI